MRTCTMAGRVGPAPLTVAARICTGARRRGCRVRAGAGARRGRAHAFRRPRLLPHQAARPSTRKRVCALADVRAERRRRLLRTGHDGRGRDPVAAPDPPRRAPGRLRAGRRHRAGERRYEHRAARFTLTRPAGARFLATSGSGTSLKAPIEVWGFSLSGKRVRVYVHYVAPRGRARKTVAVGRTGGQCGYLRTSDRKVFPFSPSRGTWTFQIDTRSRYSRHPRGPVQRIKVAVR